MKKIILVSLSLLSLSAFASNEEKIDNKLLKCVRKAARMRRFNEDTVVKAKKILADYKTVDHKVLKDRCDELIKEIKVSNTKKQHWDEQKELINKTAYMGNGIEYVLREMSDPTTVCEAGGAQVDAAAGVGVTLGIAGGQCLGTDGQRWITVTPVVGLKLGIGAAITANDYYFVFHRNRVFSTDANVILALFAAMKTSDLLGDYDGYGVGLGILFGGEASPRLKVIPQKNDFSELKEHLM